MGVKENERKVFKMEMKLSNDFNEISQEEMRDVEGGVIGMLVLSTYTSYKFTKYLYELGYENGKNSVKYGC